MDASDRIDQLLRDPRIWQAGQAVAAGPAATIPTGWADLDEALGGGWPPGQLTELLVDDHGIGELTLLLPALIHLSWRGDDEASRWVTLVSPPYVPYAPALSRAGIDLTRLLVVHSRQDVDTSWALEQALHSRTCAAVVGWSDVVDEGVLRRLQLAAEASGSWTVLFRPARLRFARSPAPLRIHLAWEVPGRRIALEVLKRRGGPPAAAHVDVSR
jgi:cell division inhibitor SulA/protein ImuA